MPNLAKTIAVASLLFTGLAVTPAAADNDHRERGGHQNWDGDNPWGAAPELHLQYAHYDDDDDDDDGYHRHHHKKHKKHAKKHRKHRKKHAKRREHYHYHEHHHYYAERPRAYDYGSYETHQDYRPHYEPQYNNRYEPSHDPYYDRRSNHGRFINETAAAGHGACNYNLYGSVIGGGLGALVGSQIGDGSGNTAAIITGALAGILVGNGVGSYIEQSDSNCVGAALDYAGDHQTISWNNPQSGNSYEVTPVRSYETESGRYCREYNTTVVVGGRAERAYGTACRQPDGDWQIQN